jgi:hypothetical protein
VIRFSRLSDEEVRHRAETLHELAKRIILLCSDKNSWGYQRLSERTGATYADVQNVGRHLQAMNLACVEAVRLGNRYNGSAIFLNENGERVREAISKSA